MTKLKIHQAICIPAAILLLATAAMAGEPPALAPFSATLQVKYGLLRGTMTLELERLETGYSYQTTLEPTGVVAWFKRGTITERSTLTDADGAILPLDYYSTDTIANPARNTSYVFDQVDGRVSGQYKSQEIDAPMRAAGHNRISAHIALMAALQANVDIATFSVFDRGRWRDYRVTVNRDQTVKTPAGTFDTVEVQYTATDKDRAWSMHFAPDHGYLPVLLVFEEDGKEKSRAQLTGYTTGNQAASAAE